MKNCPAMFLLDMYKAGHPPLYHPDITHIYVNFTNRFGKYSNVPDNTKVMHLGLQYFIIEFLVDRWEETFFRRAKSEVVNDFKEIIGSILGREVDTTHLEKLHDLGFLPLEIKSLDEGEMVPYGVPSWVVTNTVPGFGWLAEMIETVASSETWGMSTSATTAFAYRKRFERTTIDKEFLKFMGHDFSYRGMFGTQAAATSGFGHLTCLVGSDTVPAGIFARDYYGADFSSDLVMASVIATEHSIATSYLIPIINKFKRGHRYEGKTPEEHWGGPIPKGVGIHLVAEFIYLKYLMVEKVPDGILSCVIDSLDFFGVVEHVLPQLKPFIMARNGKFVCRPDSGDPVKVISGYKVAGGFDQFGRSGNFLTKESEIFQQGFLISQNQCQEMGLEAFEYFGSSYKADGTELSICETKGLFQCLWETFGGEVVNNQKVLDDHIGAIYGDSITLERQDQIISRLEFYGFCPTVVLGIGSYSYQYVTRDTNGSAIKATDIQLGGGNHVAIYKDPKTDSAKKSAKGLLLVDKHPKTGEYRLIDNVSPREEASDRNLLKPVFFNGKLVRRTTLEEIRERVDANF